MNGSTAFVILNPAAGHGRAGRAWPLTARALDEAGIRYHLARTEAPGEGTVLAARAVAQGYDPLIAVGGDGTTNEVVNAILAAPGSPETRPRLGIISCGTGRDLVRTLGIPREIRQAAAILATGAVRPFDVGRIVFHQPGGPSRTRYFVNIADAGLGGETADRVNRTTKLFGGFLSFFWGALASLARYRNKKVRLSIDGEPSHDLHLTIAVVANARYFAGGMFVAPNAVPDDGLFDIITLNGVGRLGRVPLLLRVYCGRHLGHPRLIQRRCRTVTITSEEWVHVEADGELAGFLPATFDILPGAIRIIAPAGGSSQ
ncbi:MAG: diacylglycerol kinase family lipid kinase [Thermoanaerobacterales bacterium]|nr:diacylglycerol kinase family lipid kinase [Thermoanaerobacterales bacterium]